MEQQLSNELITLSRINVANDQYNDSVKLIKYFLTEENTSPIANTYNANLFYHAWVLTDAEMASNPRSIIKDPYLGLFHPYGAIHAISTDDFLNKFIRTSNHFHDVQYFSPNNAQIFIEHDKIGKAYSVCIDDEDPSIVRIRVDLFICIPKSTVLNTAEYNFDNNTISELFTKLSQKIIFSPLFNTFELNHLKNPTFTNRIINTDVNPPVFATRRSLLLFNYDMANHPTNPLYYNDIINYTIPIDENNIPYIDDIRKELPQGIKSRSSQIRYEFGLIIASHYQ